MIITKHAKRPKSKYEPWWGDLFFTRTYMYLLRSFLPLFDNEQKFEEWVSGNILKDHYRQCYLLTPCHPAVKQLDIRGLYIIGDRLYRSIKVDIFIPSTSSVIELKCIPLFNAGLLQKLEEQMISYSKAKSVKQVFGFCFQQNQPKFISGKLVQGQWKLLFEVE